MLTIWSYARSFQSAQYSFQILHVIVTDWTEWNEPRRLEIIAKILNIMARTYENTLYII